MLRPFPRSVLILALLVAGVAVGCEDETTNVEPEVTEPPALLTRRFWYRASPPISMDNYTPLPAANAARAYWYQIEPEWGATMRDFNPETSKENDVPLTTMHIEVDSIPVDSTSWTGIMTGFSGSWDGYKGPHGVPGGLDPLDLSKSDVMKIWVNDFKPDPAERGGTIYIELGFIDEDFYLPDLNDHNLEDADRDGFEMGGEHNEDTGLDGISTWEYGDDPDDDYFSQRIPADGYRFTHINGTEWNGLPDDEDLDGNGQLDLINGYFRYEVNLSADAVQDVRRDYPAFGEFKHPEDSWRLYEIRLDDYHAVTAWGRVPYRDQIKHMRLWFDDIGKVISPRVKCIQIREIEFE